MPKIPDRTIFRLLFSRQGWIETDTMPYALNTMTIKINWLYGLILRMAMIFLTGQNNCPILFFLPMADTQLLNKGLLSLIYFVNQPFISRFNSNYNFAVFR